MLDSVCRVRSVFPVVLLYQCKVLQACSVCELRSVPCSPLTSGSAAGARHVYASEWNPAAAQALKHNLHRNGVAERCTVLEGDCTILAPQVSSWELQDP